MQFQCHVYTDQSKDQMIGNVESFANMPEHKESEMCVVIFMSHGNKDFITSRDGIKVSLSSLLDKFTKTNCPSLIGKPKVFIIQACRFVTQSIIIYSLMFVSNSLILCQGRTWGKGTANRL